LLLQGRFFFDELSDADYTSNIITREHSLKLGKGKKEDMFKLGEYEHYKGNHYRVIGIAKHSETLEKMVVYKALYGEGELWVRPLKIFTEEVEINGKKVPRFRYIGE